MKDFLGNDVEMDDYFAYPLTIGSSCQMAIFQYKGIHPSGVGVKAKPVTRSYGRTPFYEKWVPSVRAYRPMTQEERDKIDNATSTLKLFSQRAILLKDYKHEV